MNTLITTNNVGVPYRWRCHDGRLIHPAQMATSHLFNTVKMIYNHTMPEKYRLPGGRWKLHLSTEALRSAICNMMPELAKRQLNPDQYRLLRTMFENVEKEMKLSLSQLK